MVSAICPKCKILLVEATTNSFANLAAAVNTAARLGATEISNSYGGAESSSEASLAASYRHPGIPITVSSGDGGYGAQIPAAFNTVTAVGGTRLVHASNTRLGRNGLVHQHERGRRQRLLGVHRQAGVAARHRLLRSA